MKKYRIAFLCSQVIQYLDPLFRKLAENEYIELSVLYYSRAGADMYRDQEFGVDVRWDRDLLKGYDHVFLKNYSPFTKKHNYLEFMNFGLWKSLGTGNFDAVIIYGYGWLISWFAWISAISRGLPILFLGETNVLRRERENRVKRAVKENLLKVFFSKCGGIFYLGAKNREFYEHLGIADDKLFHWPYTVDNDFFMCEAARYKPEADRIKEYYNIAPGKKVILFSGKLIPKKCPMDLLRAFEIMSLKEDAVLVFAGDGILRPEMLEYTASRQITDVHLTGFLNQTELAKIYATADIFVFPSDFEPWGLSLNEAMCYSLPAIVSDQISAGYDLVKEGTNGIVFHAGNIKDLSAACDTLVRDESLRGKMGRRSFEIISEWNYTKNAKNLLAAVEYVKSGKQP